MTEKPSASCFTKFDGANLFHRLISSLILGPLALFAVYQGGLVFNLTVAAVMLWGMIEWIGLTVGRSFREGLFGGVLWVAFGVPYLGGCGYALSYIRGQPEIGGALTFYLLAVVWTTDIGAFLAGRLIGGPKLCPAVSPRKTWAGLIGGMALAALIGYGVARGFGAIRPCLATAAALVLAVVAQTGDLFESWIKRRAGVKDSGTLIPGHGGILDRIDGLIFAAVVFALFQAGMTNLTLWW